MILSIETATEVCSIALHKEGKSIAHYEIFTEKAHSSALTLLIDSILKHNKTSMQDLIGIVLSQGPGSYTGLRVGTSVAKGLCYALEIPLYAVNTLLSMVYQVNQIPAYQHLRYCPMLDARRMEVYTLLTDSKLNIIKPTKALVFTDESWVEWTSPNTPTDILIFGNGAKKCKEVSTNPQLILIENMYPSAKAIGDLFYLQKPQPVDLAYFEPFYLKEFRF
jgi:tRNA threonylcarbamoyladenosine biosynthesis protein TsaB